jgi:hypothetical protein
MYVAAIHLVLALFLVESEALWSIANLLTVFLFIVFMALDWLVRFRVARGIEREIYAKVLPFVYLSFLAGLFFLVATFAMWIRETEEHDLILRTILKGEKTHESFGLFVLAVAVWNMLLVFGVLRLRTGLSLLGYISVGNLEAHPSVAEYFADFDAWKSRTTNWLIKREWWGITEQLVAAGFESLVKLRLHFLALHTFVFNLLLGCVVLFSPSTDCVARTCALQLHLYDLWWVFLALAVAFFAGPIFVAQRHRSSTLGIDLVRYTDLGGRLAQFSKLSGFWCLAIFVLLLYWMVIATRGVGWVVVALLLQQVVVNRFYILNPPRKTQPVAEV